jgi:hypothetical protein
MLRIIASTVSVFAISALPLATLFAYALGVAQ